ncbi:unnamed protein product [Paramecium primaurelia]|uniref:RING-type domain-containing protein n=1 Tax=Paramecium primaurelia TaxID=5886 RepID=A0A8S1MP56_PARPR|nr:unnamed protein product [Paramecium primaurelia]
MQTCQLCLKNTALIQLICSHHICLKCTNKNKQLQQSQLQNKYWIQCSKCQKKTFSYDFSNLLIESHELSLLTDRSQHQFQLNEVKFYFNINFSTLQSQLIIEPQIFQRRRSMNAIDLFTKNTSPIRKEKSKNQTQKLKQSIINVNKQNVLKSSTQLKNTSNKKPTHKRCQTGIVENKQVLNSMLNFKKLTKQKTSPIQKCSSIFDYLLSLSYQHTKASDRKQFSLANSSKIDNKKNIKSRCHSQISIKQKIKN